VLTGEPEAPGKLYTMRFRSLVPVDVPRHWHPEDKKRIELAGEFLLGMEEKFSANALELLPAAGLHESRAARRTSPSTVAAPSSKSTAPSSRIIFEPAQAISRAVGVAVPFRVVLCP
jgi:hypothetical protein